jgi:hypothetical protein
LTRFGLAMTILTCFGPAMTIRAPRGPAMQTEIPGKDLEIIISEPEMRQGKPLPAHFRLAGLLLHTRGYVTLKRAVPAEIAEAAAAEFQRL